jgi:hypothetical protein
MEEMRNTYTNLVGKHVENKSLERLWLRWMKILKWILYKRWGLD